MFLLGRFPLTLLVLIFSFFKEYVKDGLHTTPFTHSLKNEKKLKRRAENRAEELIKTTDNKNLLDNISSEETKEKNIESNEFLNKKTNNLKS